jgi:hypothetical protein
MRTFRSCTLATTFEMYDISKVKIKLEKFSGQALTYLQID